MPWHLGSHRRAGGRITPAQQPDLGMSQSLGLQVNSQGRIGAASRQSAQAALLVADGAGADDSAALSGYG